MGFVCRFRFSDGGLYGLDVFRFTAKDTYCTQKNYVNGGHEANRIVESSHSLCVEIITWICIYSLARVVQNVGLCEVVVEYFHGKFVGLRVGEIDYLCTTDKVLVANFQVKIWWRGQVSFIRREYDASKGASKCFVTCL